MDTLVTKSLRLREVEFSDFDFLAELMNQAGYLNNVGDRGVRTSEDAAAYVATAALYRYDKRLGFNIVESLSNQRRLGICGLVRRDDSGLVEIGYGFLDSEAGKGFASEAAAATAAHAFDVLRLPELHGITRVENLASRRVLEKIGMTLVGIDDGNCTYRSRC